MENLIEKNIERIEGFLFDCKLEYGEMGNFIFILGTVNGQYSGDDKMLPVFNLDNHPNKVFTLSLGLHAAFNPKLNWLKASYTFDSLKIEGTNYTLGDYILTQICTLESLVSRDNDTHMKLMLQREKAKELFTPLKKLMDKYYFDIQIEGISIDRILNDGHGMADSYKIRELKMAIGGSNNEV